jgi:hypothetical protein
MKPPAKVWAACVFLIVADGHAFGSDCVPVSSVTKWEVLSSDRVLAYSGSRYIAFVTVSHGLILNCGSLVAGGPVTLRFFSPTICQYDRAIVNGEDCEVDSVQFVRQQ